MSSSSEVVKTPNEINTQQQILLSNNDNHESTTNDSSVLSSSIMTDNSTTNTSIAVPENRENDDSTLSPPTSTTKNKKSSSSTSSSSISAEKRFDNCMFSTAKALIILSAIGFFTSGVLMLSAHNAAIVDYFYDEAFPEYVVDSGRNGSHQRLVIGTTTAEPTTTTTANSSTNNTNDDGTNSTNSPIYGWYYRDSTTTIFFDGVICKNGHCHDLSTDIYVCPTMIEEIGQARDRSFYAGLLMLVGSGFTALSLFARGFANLVNFLAHKTCKVCCSRSFHHEAYHLGNSSSEKHDDDDDDNTRTTNEETRENGVDEEADAAISPEKQKAKPTMSLKQRKILKKAAELEYVCCAPDSDCAAIGKKVHDIFLILGVILMVGLACFSIDVIVEVLDLVDKPLCPNHVVNGSVFSPYNVSLNSLSSFSFGRALHLTLGSAIMCLSIVGLFVLWFVSLVCSKGGCCRFSRSGKLIGCCCCCRIGKRDGNSNDDEDEDDYDDLVYQAFDAELRERESVEQMKALQQQQHTTTLTDNNDMISESLNSTTSSSAASSSSSKRRKKVVVVGKKKKMSDQQPH